MRGPDPAYPIKLETKEYQELLKLSRATTAPQALVVRAKILLLAHDQPNYSNVQIAQQLGCAVSSVRKWRKRYHQTKKLTDAHRSGAPRRFPP
jgi:transposase